MWLSNKEKANARLVCKQWDKLISEVCIDGWWDVHLISLNIFWRCDLVSLKWISARTNLVNILLRIQALPTAPPANTLEWLLGEFKFTRTQCIDLLRCHWNLPIKIIKMIYSQMKVPPSKGEVINNIVFANRRDYDGYCGHATSFEVFDFIIKQHPYLPLKTSVPLTYLGFACVSGNIDYLNQNKDLISRLSEGEFGDLCVAGMCGSFERDKNYSAKTLKWWLNNFEEECKPIYKGLILNPDKDEACLDKMWIILFDLLETKEEKILAYTHRIYYLCHCDMEYAKQITEKVGPLTIRWTFNDYVNTCTIVKNSVKWLMTYHEIIIPAGIPSSIIELVSLDVELLRLFIKRDDFRERFRETMPTNQHVFYNVWMIASEESILLLISEGLLNKNTLAQFGVMAYAMVCNTLERFKFLYPNPTMTFQYFSQLLSDSIACDIMQYVFEHNILSWSDAPLSDLDPIIKKLIRRYLRGPVAALEWLYWTFPSAREDPRNPDEKQLWSFVDHWIGKRYGPVPTKKSE